MYLHTVHVTAQMHTATHVGLLEKDEYTTGSRWHRLWLRPDKRVRRMARAARAHADGEPMVCGGLLATFGSI